MNSVWAAVAKRSRDTAFERGGPPSAPGCKAVWRFASRRTPKRILRALFCVLFSSACFQALGAAENTNAPPSRDSQRPESGGGLGKGNESTNALPNQGFAEFKIIPDRNIFNANRRPGAANLPPKVEKQPKIDSFSLIGTLLYEEGNFAFFAGTESNYNKVLKQGEMIGGCKITSITPDSVKLETGESEVDLGMGLQMKRQDEGKWEVAVGTAASSSGSRERSLGSDNRRERSFGGDSRRSPGLSLDSRRDRSFGGSRERGGSSNGRRDRASASTPAAEEAGEPAAGNSESKTSDASTADGGGADDILKKLMQKREQELNK